MKTVGIAGQKDSVFAQKQATKLYIYLYWGKPTPKQAKCLKRSLNALNGVKNV